MNNDLTVGNPYKVLWKFCLPLFGSVIFQQLYNLADSFVAGKFIGEEALAAVGNSYEITLIYIAFAFGCNIGCSVVTATLYGAKRYRDMKTAVYTSLVSTGVLCAVLMLIGTVFGTQMLELINTPENILEQSKIYLEIYVWSLPFVFFYNLATGIFSAFGDSKTPFIFLAVSSLSNIGVDILFVTAFDMGVAGVAWATFLCQCISCILAVAVVFWKFSKIKTQEKPQVFSWTLFKKLSSIAVPSILQQCFVSIGNIIIQGTINGFGSSVIAGYSAAVKLNNLVITSMNTLGNGVSNYAAQNLGAGKKERIHDGMKSGIKIVWTICVPLAILYFVFGRTLLKIFLNDASAQALDVGMMFLRIISPFYLLISVKLIADGILRGGEKMLQFMIATFTDLILRVILSSILASRFGPTGIWSAWPIGWTVATALSLIFYFEYKKKFLSRQDN